MIFPSFQCFKLTLILESSVTLSVYMFQIYFHSTVHACDLHNDLYKSSCALYCGANPHRQVEPVLLAEPFKLNTQLRFIIKGN